MKIPYILRSYFNQRAVQQKIRREAGPNILNLIASLRPWETERPLIRLGPWKDGGYLVPDDLEGIEACFSPGVGQISGFETDCVSRGMKVFLVDGSVEGPAQSDAGLQFLKKHIGLITNDTSTTMDDWANACDTRQNSDLMLQMDIEGFEWLALANMSGPLLKRCRILVVEFHSLSELWNHSFYRMASSVLERILDTHICVHIHPNNCKPPHRNRQQIPIPPIMEFTFLRKDRVSHKTPASSFPHPLDCDNTPKRHYALPTIWYREPLT